mmetsp:Transcript_51160/g.121794  ORF Transcript_51160/g.121794 Transcript_51160/m.121794 type:complete len:205 (+) Transcript_51160:215-829(+)
MSSPSWGYFVALRLFLPLSIAIWSVYVVLCLFPGDPLAACHDISWHDKAWNMTGEPCACWALGPEVPFKALQSQMEPGCDPFLMLTLATVGFIASCSLSMDSLLWISAAGPSPLSLIVQAGDVNARPESPQQRSVLWLQVILAAPVAALLVLGVFFLGATGHLLEGGMALVAVGPSWVIAEDAWRRLKSIDEDGFRPMRLVTST